MPHLPCGGVHACCHAVSAVICAAHDEQCGAAAQAHAIHPDVLWCVLCHGMLLRSRSAVICATHGEHCGAATPSNATCCAVVRAVLSLPCPDIHAATVTIITVPSHAIASMCNMLLLPSRTTAPASSSAVTAGDAASATGCVSSQVGLPNPVLCPAICTAGKKA
jgi:hypothetical protein